MGHTQETDRVIVVDADELSRHVMARRLRRWGYEPMLCVHAGEAVDLLRRVPVCALVSDMHMPGTDGLALARAVRELQPELPIFLMTSRPAPDSRVQARAAGARDLLPKQAGLAEGLRQALFAALGACHELSRIEELLESAARP